LKLHPDKHCLKMKYLLKCLFRVKYLMLFSMLLLMPLACVSQEVFAWKGRYLYQDQLGKTFGGSPMLIDMNLNVKADGSCLLAINGYQVSERIFCRAVSKSTGLQIDFISYDSGKIENEYGVQIYQVGESLFSLDGSQDKFLTTWKSLKPDNVEAVTGSFFVKQKTEK